MPIVILQIVVIGYIINKVKVLTAYLVSRHTIVLPGIGRSGCGKIGIFLAAHTGLRLIRERKKASIEKMLYVWLVMWSFSFSAGIINGDNCRKALCFLRIMM